MAGYTRQSSTTIISGLPVLAGSVNAELNQVLAAFHATTGHKHDGTAAEGPYIALVSSANTNNQVRTSGDTVQVKIAGTNMAEFRANKFQPTSGATVDLGTTGDAFSTAHIDTLKVYSGIVVGASATIDLGGKVAANAGTPVSTGDLVTLEYLDAQVSALVTLSTTSTTSNAVGTGSKTFTNVEDIKLEAGAFVVVADAAAPTTNWMFGQVTSYTSGTKEMIVNVTRIAGSGTKTSWTVQVSGAEGITGALSNLAAEDFSMNGFNITVYVDGSPFTQDELYATLLAI
jgi:hypothetical protein